MLDHVSLGVSDLERSRQFYDAALDSLGIKRLVDFEQRGSDYGVGEAPFGVEFTITKETNVIASTGMHVCFQANDRQTVIEFYAAALLTGGRCDGEPGIRPAYHADYFAAFVLDPDGHRIEVACHAPASTGLRQDEHFNMNFRDHQVTVRRATGIDADVVADLARAFHAEDGHPLSDALIEELERRARESGCKAIHLEVMPGNRAESWYRRLGWGDRGSKLLTKVI